MSYGGNFTDKEQKNSDTRKIQLAVKNHSREYDAEKVQKSTAPFKSLPPSFERKNVIFSNDSGGNFTDEVQKPTAPCEESRKGRLTVSIWRDLCSDKVQVLRNSPFYPDFPSEELTHDISEFQIEDNKIEYGHRKP